MNSLLSRLPQYPLAALLALLPLVGCGSDDDDTPSTPPETVGLSLLGQPLEVASVGEPARAAAEALWQEITLDNDYTTWPLVPGTTESQASAAPHGDFATLRYSGTNPAAPEDGFIVVKENLVGDATTLDALTVMAKVTGFDADNADWFYAKFQLDGTLDATPAGLPLAGAVEPAPGMACRGCHRGAPGGDFLWE